MNSKIAFQTRELSPDERRMLKSLHTRTQKAAVGWIKSWHWLIAVALGVGGVLLAIHTERDSLRSLFALIAVFSLGFVFFTPSVMFKQRRGRRELLQRLSAFIERGTVGVHPMSATRIALAREYEDEGDLYIVELDAERVLYINDAEYNMSSKFPCLRFEIYDDEFASLTGRRVLPQSGKEKFVEIDPKKKWAYWMAHGVPGDLTVENVNFDTLVGLYNTPQKP